MEKCIPFLCKVANDRIRNAGLSTGYANGYVAVSKSHPWFNKSYFGEIENSINIHGGVTFSGKLKGVSPDSLIMINEGEKLPEEYWAFGFDTMHFLDNLDTCNKDFCISETLRLKEQLEKIK